MNKRGITGFGAFDRHPAAHTPKQFESVMYEIAREAGLKVAAINLAGVTPSFHEAVLQSADTNVSVVCSIVFRIVAFARPIEPLVCHLQFCKAPDLSKGFLTRGFTVLEPSELRIPISHCDLNTLEDAELNQIAYWKPTTLGELIFNWWD